MVVSWRWWLWVRVFRVEQAQRVKQHLLHRAPRPRIELAFALITAPPPHDQYHFLPNDRLTIQPIYRELSTRPIAKSGDWAVILVKHLQHCEWNVVPAGALFCVPMIAFQRKHQLPGWMWYNLFFFFLQFNLKRSNIFFIFTSIPSTRVKC